MLLITGFARSCGFISNFNVNLQVISHGLDLDIAWNHGFINMICGFDCQTVMR